MVKKERQRIRTPIKATLFLLFRKLEKEYYCLLFVCIHQGMQVNSENRVVIN